MLTGLKNRIFWVLYIYCYQVYKYNSVLFTVCNCIQNKSICETHKHLLRWSPHLLSLSCELPVVSIPPLPFLISSPPPPLIEEPELESIWFSNREKDVKLHYFDNERKCLLNFTRSYHPYRSGSSGSVVDLGHCWWSGLCWGSSVAAHWSDTLHCLSVLCLHWSACPLPSRLLVSPCSGAVLFCH